MVFILWIIILPLTLVGGIYMLYSIKTAKPQILIDERELNQYRLMLNDALIGDTKLWDDNDWDKYNELNDKYESIVHTHFKPTTVKRTNIEPQVSNYIKSRRLLNYEREWTGANGTTISLPRTPHESQAFVNHKARDIIARNNEEMRRIGIKANNNFIDAYFEPDTNRIRIEEKSLLGDKIKTIYILPEEYAHITNEQFKKQFGIEKPIHYQLPLI